MPVEGRVCTMHDTMMTNADTNSIYARLRLDSTPMMVNSVWRNVVSKLFCCRRHYIGSRVANCPTQGSFGACLIAVLFTV